VALATAAVGERKSLLSLQEKKRLAVAKIPQPPPIRHHQAEEDDEIDIDALFFLPGGILEQDDDCSDNCQQEQQQPLSLPGERRQQRNNQYGHNDPGPSFTDHRPLFHRHWTSSNDIDDQGRRVTNLEGASDLLVAGLAYDLLKSPLPDDPPPSTPPPLSAPPLGFVGFERPLVPFTRASISLSSSPTTKTNLVHVGTTMRKNDDVIVTEQHDPPTEESTSSSSSFPQQVQLAPKKKRRVETTPERSSQIVANNSKMVGGNSFPPAFAARSSASCRLPVPQPAEPTSTKSKAAALTKMCNEILDVVPVVADDVAAVAVADNDSIESSDNSCVCDLSITTQKSTSVFEDKGEKTVQESSSAAKSSAKSTPMDDAAASAVGVLLELFQIQRLCHYLQSFLRTCFVEPILLLQQALSNWWYPRLLAQTRLYVTRLLRALRLALHLAFIVSSAISAVSSCAFCECFSYSPTTTPTTTISFYYRLPVVFFSYTPTKSALIYLIFLFTPTACDLLMHYFTLPHFLPHILSILTLFSCIATGHHDKTRVPGRLSFYLSTALRWTMIPFILYYDGLFGDTTISLMRLEATRRATLAFGVALLHHSLILSPLAWLALALQQQFLITSLLFGSSSMATSAVLTISSLATLYHLRSLSTTTTARSRKR
jgi:uncharacterized membrane protein YuzA (DUF378 family)